MMYYLIIKKFLQFSLIINGYLLISFNANAVPSMARQTGYSCAQCHVGFPELTNFGRQFKLGGYTMSSNKWDELSSIEKIPLSGGVQISRISSNDRSSGGVVGLTDFPKDKKIIAQTAAFYYGGKITENIGALIQYNYDGVEQKFGMEMFDARYADSTEVAGKELLFGVTLNNNPTVSDIYNTTPAWGFPHVGTAAKQMPLTSLIDMTLASKVAGVGFYGMWDDLIYAELAAYRAANSGASRILAAGQRWNDAEQIGQVVQGMAPYWRIALQQRIGAHTFEMGTYGMLAKTWQDVTNTSLGLNQYRDIAFDGNYHYLSGNHSSSIGATLIKERKKWSSSAQTSEITSNAFDSLKTLRVNFHYYYRRQWGGGLQYFKTSGTSNNLAYNTGDALTGSFSGSPNSSGWISEINYYPIENLKLVLRMTAYQTFNGAALNYNGNGRNASNNNSVYLLGWYVF